MGGAPDPLAVLVVPDAFSVLVISAVLYLSVQLVCIARSRACCIANAGAGAWAQVVNMGFNLDAALASGSTSGAQLQAPFGVLPSDQGMLWLSLSRALNCLEVPGARWDNPGEVWQSAWLLLPQTPGCCCFPLTIFLALFGICLSIVKLPFAAVAVVLWYLLPAQLCFLLNYPRYVRRVYVAVGGCRHWGCVLRALGSIVLLVPLLAVPPLQLFGCFWFSIWLAVFQAFRWTAQATNLAAAFFGFGRVAADSARVGAAYMASIELLVEEIVKWGLEEARPGEPNYHEIRCDVLLVSVIVLALALLSTFPLLVALALLKATLFLLKCYSMYFRSVRLVCFACPCCCLPVLLPLFGLLAVLIPLGWALALGFVLVGALVGAPLCGVLAVFGTADHGGHACAQLGAGLHANLAIVVVADRVSDLVLAFSVDRDGEKKLAEAIEATLPTLGHDGRVSFPPRPDRPPPFLCWPCAWLLLQPPRRASEGQLPTVAPKDSSASSADTAAPETPPAAARWGPLVLVWAGTAAACYAMMNAAEVLPAALALRSTAAVLL